MIDSAVFFSLIASIASAILAVIAIWIALYGKAEADKTNKKTQELLTEIRGDAKSIAQVAMPELKAYGDSVRRHIFKGEDTITSSSVEQIEKSVNEAMNKIMDELREVKEMPDLNTAFARLKKVEAQIEQSKKTIEKSVREEKETITINTGRGFFELHKLDRDNWMHVVEMIIKERELRRENYGKTWVIQNDKTGEILSAERVFNPQIPLKFAGIKKNNIFNIVPVETVTIGNRGETAK